ncbi:MAG: hypothetical protein ACK4OO_02880 [bacterium]
MPRGYNALSLPLTLGGWLLLFTFCSQPSSPSYPYWTLINQTSFGRQPQWDPLGELILFGDDREGTSGIWLWDLIRPPSLITRPTSHHNWDYTWSPNGDWFAFSVEDHWGSQERGIWIGDRSGTTLRRLWDKGRSPSWWREGEGVLVEVSDPDGDTEIWLVPLNLPESQPRLIGPGFLPQGSPDGEAYLYRDRRYQGRLFLVLSLTSPPQPLSPPGVIQARWSGSGEGIFYTLASPRLPEELPYLCRHLIAPNQTDTLFRGGLEFSLDRTGERVAFTDITGGRSSGIRVWRRGEFPELVSSQGFAPAHHPTLDRIALTQPEGGITIYERRER